MLKNNTSVACYTRLPQEDSIYSAKLAYSMHLAIKNENESYRALNHNCGILFAKATEGEEGALTAKSLKSPYLFKQEDGMYGVIAVRTEAFGEIEEESKGKVLYFTTKDLLQYDEIGFLELKANTVINQVLCEYSKDLRSYIIQWKDTDGNWYKNEWKESQELDNVSESVRIESVDFKEISLGIEETIPGNEIEVDKEIVNQMILRLETPENTGVSVLDQVIISSKEDLQNVKALLHYSDGTSCRRKVDWVLDSIDFDKPGIYEVNGKIHQDHYPFPIAINRADPCIARWEGKYYFIATNDADGNHTIFIREADTISDLVDAEEVLILDSTTYESIGNLLWAPELHTIGEDLYIFHAATPGEFLCEESHVMKLRRGGNPTNRADWSAPKRVVKKDGSYLCEEGKVISLDMTVFSWENEYYVVWSQRQFVPVDNGAWLYIAKVNPEEPWRLTSDPVLLSKPDYGWANNHTFVDEGPFALIRDGQLYLTFSSAAVDATYVVGLLTAKQGSDLLSPDSWVKTNYPLLTSRSVEGQYGPGHNSYVEDEEGLIWNAYHARAGLEEPRSSGIRRVHFNKAGFPILDMTEEKDIKEEYKDVKVEIQIT